MGNNINFNSRWGIEIQEGNDNYIYHNNLLYNYRNAVDGGKNIWDDGKYGNYWSDYKDNNPFGKRNLLKPWMWNIPYEIDGGDNKDNCPLINEWPSPKPRTITSDTSIFNPFWQGFIDMFPILVRILGLLS